MTQATVLIADDDDNILLALGMLLQAKGLSSVSANAPAQVLPLLKNHEPDIVIMDLNYSLDTTSGAEGIGLIADIRASFENIPIIVMTAWGSIDIAVAAMKSGANDFVQKPWENDRLDASIQTQLNVAKLQKAQLKLVRENQILNEAANPLAPIITQSEEVQTALQTLHQVAETDISVLFTGENGTGKSMFARYLHQISHRKDAPLISVNMGAVAESLFESEMFGHTKGAFTDAKTQRVGRFELADGGTLFLDEIANTPFSQQGKLLRVLEEQQFERVGSSKTLSSDIRVISATNTNLENAVENGSFRKDLLYRLNSIQIEIPPLRARRADIIPLAKAFLQQAAKKYNQEAPDIGSAVTSALLSYAWPGNVRELSHVMERAQILCRSEALAVEDLRLKDSSAPVKILSNKGSLLTLKEIEQQVIEERVEHFEGDAALAAKSLDLSKSAFYRRWEKAKQ